MIDSQEYNKNSEIPDKQNNSSAFQDSAFQKLRVNCEKCFGLCCVALYFSVSEGFPADKVAGKPCINLQSDFRCIIHNKLRAQGLKGCTAYDCFGAGQRISEITYSGHDWIKAPESAKQMFEVFLIMRQLHEMLWYLTEALTLQVALPIHDRLKDMLSETEQLSYQSPEALLGLDLSVLRGRINPLLLHTSELVRSKVQNEQKRSTSRQKAISRGLDFIGADLRRTNLKGSSFRGAYLIRADLRGADLSGVDFIGADMRDSDLRGADLTNSIFLTQAQINTTKGDSKTKLPPTIVRPWFWPNW